MAKLYITEYPAFLSVAAIEPATTTQTPVTIGGTSTNSSAFTNKTRFIRVHTDAICSIEVGKNPTATANSKRLAANQTEYFAVNKGDKLAVITNS